MQAFTITHVDIGVSYYATSLDFNPIRTCQYGNCLNKVSTDEILQ